jgi:hypothetical protein
MHAFKPKHGIIFYYNLILNFYKRKLSHKKINSRKVSQNTWAADNAGLHSVSQHPCNNGLLLYCHNNGTETESVS